MMRSIYLSFVAAVVLTLSACGGGGGGSSGTTSNSGSGTTTNFNNVANISIDTGPTGATGEINIPYVSVNLCNSSGSCQTIDHIQLDTGSFGLRVLASAVSNPSQFNAVTDSSGNPLGECVIFGDGYTWGSVRRATVQMSSEVASNIPVNFIADTNIQGTAPAGCISQASNPIVGSAGNNDNSLTALGANGILGIGSFTYDCGIYCAQAVFEGAYYSCPSSGCVATSVPLTNQVINPVAVFAADSNGVSDNNGTLINIPSVSTNGATVAYGTLTFGIGTRSNNSLTGVTVYTLQGSTSDYPGNFTSTYKGQAYAQSFVDSGSNALYFTDTSITQCTGANSGFYCPSSTLSLTATDTSTSNVTSPVISFAVGNLNQATTNLPGISAYAAVAGTNGNSASFDWGFPFFYGRNIYTAIEGKTAGTATGPYVAF